MNISINEMAIPMSILLFFCFLGQLWGAKFSLVLSMACGGIVFENEFYKFLLVFSTGFSFQTYEAPIEGIMVVSSLHLIGYLSSKALSMKPTFNYVVSKLRIQAVTFGFQKFSCLSS